MATKFCLFFGVLLVVMIGQSKSPTLDPTGSYKLYRDTVTKEGETYGYFGEIMVKALGNSRIAITLFVCKGAPSYNLGTVWDTLNMKGNIATYLSIDDSTCKITFTFKRKKIIVHQVQGDPNFGCGFGHGVFADGTYIKTSNEIPLIEDPSQG